MGLTKIQEEFINKLVSTPEGQEAIGAATVKFVREAIVRNKKSITERAYDELKKDGLIKEEINETP